MKKWKFFRKNQNVYVKKRFKHIYNNQFLKDDQYLENLLTVKQYDNPEYIAEQINLVLQKDQKKLSVQLINYSNQQDLKAEKLLDQFLI